MKKLFALLLSFALFFTLVPFGVSAVEVEQQNYNTFVDKAIAAFPEYAEKLSNPSYHTSEHTRSATDRVLVVKETRPISDKESITYAEYSDGLILLSGYEFTYESTCVDSNTGNTEKSITINIEAAYVVDGHTEGYFNLNGVSYVLRYGVNNFDCITSPGTAVKGTNCVSATREDYTADESYTGYAQVIYMLGFKIGNYAGDVATSYLTLHVGEDTAVINHTDWN